MDSSKYQIGYYLPPIVTQDWVSKHYISKPPIWCSVDLRDGNQALIIPMNLEEKIEFFKLLVEIGFKEIEVGFPAASETEYEFLRKLIDDKLIPDDVTIQVLTQSRDHIIEKTFKALEGVDKAIVHFYNSTSSVQREQVFKKNREEIIEIAKEGAKSVLKYASKTKGNFKFQYSPESFTGTEMDFAVDICNEVISILKPTNRNKLIINLPSTVQYSMPHVYATQIEYMCKNLKDRENLIISLHPHNDRGSAISDAEMGILAGADRVEGTLFGNGERTGNVDIVNLALNLYTQGVNPNLDFSNILKIASTYEKITRMTVHVRQPYSGKLVFAAFSGSHQDAIAKGMKWHENNNEYWNVPYLPINPCDLGRVYESDVIRINSQSGKGGIGYLLEQNYGYNLPSKLKEIFGYEIKSVSDRGERELLVQEINDIFTENYINLNSNLKFLDCTFSKNNKTDVSMKIDEIKSDISNIITLSGQGNGPLDSVKNSITNYFNWEFDIIDYQEHALTKGSDSKAISYIEIKFNNKNYWGVGIDSDIIESSILALFSALNKAIKN
ncbi:MAG: 2-isopropylmalate synthase [Fusobacteriaceae bacterium]